ncbi:hypothetical protein [Methanospirillum sp.]|uniref:hypothetical protein n=1 Tax=Methanospirillum sp. TaxID=45200 RepID=UPI00359F1846
MGLIDMNACKLRRLGILLIIILVLTTGWASAVRPTSALFDNTGITTTIDATCIGTLLVNHDMEWQQTNLAGGNLANNTLTEGETRAIFTYRENTLAAMGTTKYTKEYNMDGSNVSEGRDNLYARHMVNYEANLENSGSMLWDEEATISSFGAATTGADVGRCVFASGSSSSGAGFKGTVSAGSNMDVREVAAVTTVGGRAISESSTVPVNLRYGFDAQGLGTDENNALAVGSAEVFMNTEFRVYDNLYNATVTGGNLTTRITDRQRTVASGLFDLAQTHEYSSTT